MHTLFHFLVCIIVKFIKNVLIWIWFHFKFACKHDSKKEQPKGSPSTENIFVLYFSGKMAKRKRETLEEEHPKHKKKKRNEEEPPEPESPPKGEFDYEILDKFWNFNILRENKEKGWLLRAINSRKHRHRKAVSRGKVTTFIFHIASVSKYPRRQEMQYKNFDNTKMKFEDRIILHFQLMFLL